MTPPEDNDSAGNQPRQPGQPRQAAQVTPIDAAALFQGRQQVLIQHDGEIYRLVLTRNNKLLLQK